MRTQKPQPMSPVERHPFEPFLPDGACILFLGSFPPQPHRWCMPFFYPNWINDFWRIMGLIHFGDKNHFCLPAEKRFDEAAIRAFCTSAGLAFYDTATAVRRLRDNASDTFLEIITPTDIPSLLARIPTCHTLVTTGQKATETLSATLACPLPPVGGFVDILLPCPDLSVRPDPDLSVQPDPDLSVLPDPNPSFAGRASSFAGLTGESPRPLRFHRMPSTSRAYPLPLEQKAAAYKTLFNE